MPRIGGVSGSTHARPGRGTGVDEAFDILRKASQDLNVKIRDLAKTITERRAEL